MSVLGLKDKALVVRLKEKQLSASRWRSCRQTEIYCWRENSVMGDVFKPRDPTVLLLEQWMAGRQRDGTGRDGTVWMGTLVLCFWRRSFCWGVWFKDRNVEGRRGLTCQSSVCVNQLDSFSVNVCQLVLPFIIRLHEHINCQHNIQTISLNDFLKISWNSLSSVNHERLVLIHVHGAFSIAGACAI